MRVSTSSASNSFAACRSPVSNPSVNQQYDFSKLRHPVRNSLLKRSQIVFYNVPHNPQVDIKVSMNQPISETNNLGSGYVGVLRAELIRQVAAGLVNNF